MLRTVGKAALRRVVVTGLGVCCPLGVGTRTVWKRLLEARSGITRLPESFQSQVPSQVAGLVPRGGGPDCFKEEDWVSSEERRSMDLSSLFAVCATDEALEDAKWRPKSARDRENTGTSIGRVMSGIEELVQAVPTFSSGSYQDLSTFLVPHILTNMAAAHISIRYNLLGPIHSVSTACTSGLHAIGDSAAMISRGACDVMVAGGSEGFLHPLIFGALCRIKALSKNFNSHPQRASRPFDSARDGFVVSEGAAVVVLEELEHAKQRGAPIYAEILGYGMSSDAYHVFRPCEDANGVRHSMQMAIKDAGISPDSVQHINAHATSTVLGDRAENKAIKDFFGEHAYKLLVSATKSMTGHLIAASGALETVFTVLAVRDGIAPPTINLENLEPEFDLNYVPDHPVQWTGNGGRRIALKNSFGFGGANATLCIGEV